MKRSTLYIVLGAVAVILIGVIVWQSGTTQDQEQDVRSAVVERGTMLVAVSASGRVEPEAELGLAFEQPGPVAQVPVQVEDRVETGDLLAKLDVERLELQAEQARARLASAEAQLARLRRPPQPEEVAAAEANLRSTQAQVSAAAANRDQVEGGATGAQIAAAEAELASAITEQRKAEEVHDLTMTCVTFKLPAGEVIKLPDGTVITTTEPFKDTVCPALGPPEEQARYNLQAADASLAAAQSRLDELQAGADENQIRAARADVWAAAAQRDAAQAQLDLLLAGSTDEQIAAAEAQVAQAEAAMEQAELSLEYAELRAPFDGVVAAINVTAGETAPMGLPAIVLVDDSGFRVTISVDEIDVGRLSEGQTAQVTLDALPESVITGTVERIAPAATIEGGVVYYDVFVDLSPTDIPIRADMSANATIVVEELTDVLMLPTWVVRVERITGQTYVYRKVAEGNEQIDVRLGVRHEGMVQVLDGLSEGDEIVWVQEDEGFGFGERR